MPDTQFSTKEAATALATEVKAALALSKLLLGDDSYTPTVFSSASELGAHEIEASGYTAGGYTLTAFLGPLNDPDGGSYVTSPMVNIVYGPVADPPVTAMVGYWWVEDASGDVRAVGIFDPPRPLSSLGDGWQQVVQLVYGRNPAPFVPE